MQRERLICNKFSGINRRSSIFGQGLITASDIQNVELFSTEKNLGVGIRTTKGNISICDLLPDDEIIINIFQSVQKLKTYFFVHTENLTEGKIYLFSLETGELKLKKNGLSKTGQSSATDVTQGWSDLWVFSNSEEILSIELENYTEEGLLDEVKMMDLEDMDGRKIRGLGLVVFAGRLWIFNHQVLWYSVQENIYDFSTSDTNIKTSAGYIEFVKNITAIYPYIGSLAVFHANSSCIIGQNEDGTEFYKTLDFPGGCSGINALVFHGTQLFFYDDTKKGIFSFIQVINGDKTLGDNIALDIQDELFQLPIELSPKVKMLSVVTSERNEVWLLIPNDGSEYSTILIYDYNQKTWLKRKSQKINSIAMINGKLYSAGKKIYEEYVSNEFDGEFIESFYKCTPLNLGVENSQKILAYPPKVTLDMYYSNHFFIEYTRDYNSMTTKIREIISKTLQNVLYFDKGFWDEMTFPHEKINSIKRLPSSFFKTLQISFYTKEVGQNFCINNIEFGKIKVKS